MRACSWVLLRLRALRAQEFVLLTNGEAMVEEDEEHRTAPGCFWLSFAGAVVAIFGLGLYWDHMNRALECDGDLKGLREQVDGLRRRVEKLEQTHESPHK